MLLEKSLKILGIIWNILNKSKLNSLVQRIKHQALSGNGFTEGENRNKRIPNESNL